MKQIKKKKFKNYIFEIHDEELFQYASSLSFHTMLSLLPILMLSLSIFTKLPSFEEYYKKIKQFIFSSLLPSHQETISSYLEQFIQNSVSISVVGIVAILFTSIMFFVDYEYIIKKITKSEKRGFWRGLSSYWTLITLTPIGLGLSFYLSSEVQNLLDQTKYTSQINVLQFLPYLIIWGIFTITYTVSINRDISTKNLLLSSFIASFVWSISKIIFIEYALYNKTYLSIYGSFSTLLFFFLWVYISWIIFLYGVKICYLLDEQDDNKNKTNKGQNKG